VAKAEGKKKFGRPRRRWEDNIKMDLQEVGGGGMEWVNGENYTMRSLIFCTHRIFFE
jgi:hypothetical protein